MIDNSRFVSVDDPYIVVIDYEELREKQLPIGEADKAKLIQVRTNLFNDEVSSLAQDLYTGKISIGSWEETMRKMVRELHTSVAAIGKGGWNEMTWADWGRLGPQMKEQYQYLHKFAQHISENRDTISLAQVEARSRLYGKAAGHSAVMMSANDAIIRQLPYVPRDGSTECLVGCCCQWDISIIDKEGEWNIVEFIWRNNPAEHCEDCVARNGHIEVLRLHESIDVPDKIGGYCI